MKILLAGYFGHGNFGDDVLFKAAITFAHRNWRHSEITVLTEAANPSYLEALAGQELRFIKLGQNGRFDLVLHGGGGTFFDFAPGSAADLWINRLGRAIGPRRFARGMSGVRRLAMRPEHSATMRVGVGIGVGSHSASSTRLKWHLQTLHEFDWLAVRDPQSRRNLEALGVVDEVHESTDLAFATDLWLSNDLCRSGRGAGVVVIVRDWTDHAGRRLQERIIDTLGTRTNCRITFVFLDQQADSAIRSKILGAQETYRAGNISSILQILREASVVISSRAHGAIAGAIAGKPVLLIPVEPKLEAIQSMLSVSSRLLRQGSVKALEEGLSWAREVDRAAIQADVDRNREQMNRTLRDLAAFVDGRLLSARRQ